MEQQEAAEPVKPTGRLKISEKAQTESHREYLDMDTDEEEFGHQETPEPQDEAPPEPDKPVFTDSDLDILVEYTKELTVLPGLLDEHWNDACTATIREYFCDPTRCVLTIFFYENNLCALLDFPAYTDTGLVYFLRDPWQVYLVENFMSSVIFGSISERTENTVLRFTGGLYAPLAFKSEEWPGIMKDEIFSNLNDFLTLAFDVTYKPIGMLILYVPWEGTQINNETENLKTDDESVIRIKFQNEHELRINRLEKVTRTWIRQIRESLRVSPILTDELHDVISEFDFWQSKYENLACISRQLKNDRLLLIIKQLRRVKSSSINDLRLLVKKVNNALDEAKSNLTCLDVILENCKLLDSPEKVQDCLPRILNVIRFVWIESPYYKSPANIERLLCSLSVHIVKLCIKNIDLKLIFDDPKKCREDLALILDCCSSYSKIYNNVIDNCLALHDNWSVKKNTVFNCINAFEQRCQDVSEICEAIIIYGSLNKINLGGTRGNQHEMQYSRVKDYFLQIMDEMRVCCDYALDITEIKWFHDMSNFREDVAELENTIKNLLKNLFEDVKNVDMGIETLYTLLKFKERRGFQEILHNKWIQVWEIFFEEIKICSLALEEYEIIPDNLRLLRSENSIMSDIYRNYLKRLQKKMINATDWLGDCDIQCEVTSKYLDTKVHRQSTNLLSLELYSSLNK